MRGMVGPLPDLCVLQVAEAYSGLEPLDLPIVASMGMSAEKTLVESQFGLVQRGSVSSYQLPKLPTGYIEIHPNAPPSPCLPLKAHVSIRVSVVLHGGGTFASDESAVVHGDGPQS